MKIRTESSFISKTMTSRNPLGLNLMGKKAQLCHNLHRHNMSHSLSSSIMEDQGITRMNLFSFVYILIICRFEDE